MMTLRLGESLGSGVGALNVAGRLGPSGPDHMSAHFLDAIERIEAHHRQRHLDGCSVLERLADGGFLNPAVQGPLNLVARHGEVDLGAANDRYGHAHDDAAHPRPDRPSCPDACRR